MFKLKRVHIIKKNIGACRYELLQGPPDLDYAAVNEDAKAGAPFRGLAEARIYDEDIRTNLTIIKTEVIEDAYKMVLGKEIMRRYINKISEVNWRIPIVYKSDVASYCYGYSDTDGKDFIMDDEFLYEVEEFMTSRMCYAVDSDELIIQLMDREVEEVKDKLEAIIENNPQKRIYVIILQSDCSWEESSDLERCKCQEPAIASMIVKYNAAYFHIRKDLNYYKQLLEEMAEEEGVIIDYESFDIDRFVRLVVNTQTMSAGFLDDLVKWVKKRSGILNHDIYGFIIKEDEEEDDNEYRIW